MDPVLHGLIQRWFVRSTKDNLSESGWFGLGIGGAEETRKQCEKGGVRYGFFVCGPWNGVRHCRIRFTQEPATRILHRQVSLA